MCENETTTIFAVKYLLKVRGRAHRSIARLSHLCSVSVSTLPSESFFLGLVDKSDDGVDERARSLEVSVLDGGSMTVGNYMRRSTLPRFRTGSDELKFKLQGDKLR